MHKLKNPRVYLGFLAPQARYRLKKNRLELPIFIAKSTNGRLKLTIDREELPNYLDLSLKKCYQLTEGFYLPEIKIINNPRTKIDYKILAGQYKLLIDNGTVLNQAALARRLNVSRAWVTKVCRIANNIED